MTLTLRTRRVMSTIWALCYRL